MFRLAEWEQRELSHLSIAVNISPKQFEKSNLLNQLKDLITATQVNSNLLEFELTENSVMKNCKSALKILSTISDLGIKLSIDDFGTGYCSFRYLKEFPIDIIKIDRSFITSIEKSKNDAIILMAHNLGLTVVAEGVENEQQQAFLKSNNCDIAQGYLYSRWRNLTKICA